MTFKVNSGGNECSFKFHDHISSTARIGFGCKSHEGNDFFFPIAGDIPLGISVGYQDSLF